jgi:hypothetical protein
MTRTAHSTHTLTAHEALLARFAFAPFTRITARRAGLEAALWECEAAGLVKFVRCVGTVYCSDNELFRCLG